MSSEVPRQPSASRTPTLEGFCPGVSVLEDCSSEGFNSRGFCMRGLCPGVNVRLPTHVGRVVLVRGQARLPIMGDGPQRDSFLLVPT